MISIEKEEMKEAVGLLKNEGILLHRADTLWGLICDATSPVAVKELNTILRRPLGEPFVILVHNEAMLERYVEQVPEVAWELIDTAVNPLTIIYPKGRSLAAGVCAADGSIAVRIVEDQVTKRMIQSLGRPIISALATFIEGKAPLDPEEIPKEIVDKVGGLISDRPRTEAHNKVSSIIKLGLHGEVSIIRS